MNERWTVVFSGVLVSVANPVGEREADVGGRLGFTPTVELADRLPQRREWFMNTVDSEGVVVEQ